MSMSLKHLKNGCHISSSAQCMREHHGVIAGADLAQCLVIDAPGAQQHEQRAVRAVADEVNGVVVMLDQERLCGRASTECCGHLHKVYGQKGVNLKHSSSQPHYEVTPLKA